MAKTYEPIATQTLGSAAASVTFSSIPSTYTDLVLVIAGTVSVNGESIVAQYNGDTATNYSYTFLYGNGTSALSSRQSTKTAVGVSWNVGFSSTEQCNATMQIQNYSNATTYKTSLTRGNNTSGSSLPGTEASVGLWRSTAAITSLLIKPGSGNLSTGFTLTLYGIKAA